MTKTVNALALRQQLGRMLDEAYYRGDEFVIERSGRPLAALIGIGEYAKLSELREQAFSAIRRLWQRNQGVATQQVEKDVARAVKRTRRRR